MNKDSITISRRGAAHIIPVMISGGIFMNLVIDGSGKYLNSAWICVAAGFVITLPVVILIDRLQEKKLNALWQAACITASAYMLFQTAAVSRLLVNSVSYSNFATQKPSLLTAVMLLVCLYVICKSSAGIGNAAKVCGILFLILFAVVITANLKYMNIRWLAPIMSAGTMRIIQGSMIAAGYILTSALIYIPAENGGQFRGGCLRASAFGSAIALLLCLYAAVMSPLQLGGNVDRLQGIETLISNGRSSLGVQLPITLMWFLGYVMVLASYAFSGALFLQQVMKNACPLLIGSIAVAAAYILANTALAESRQVELVSRYSLFGAVVIVLTACISGRKANRDV